MTIPSFDWKTGRSKSLACSNFSYTNSPTESIFFRSFSFNVFSKTSHIILIRDASYVMFHILPCVLSFNCFGIDGMIVFKSSSRIRQSEVLVNFCFRIFFFITNVFVIIIRILFTSVGFRVSGRVIKSGFMLICVRITSQYQF